MDSGTPDEDKGPQSPAPGSAPGPPPGSAPGPPAPPNPEAPAGPQAPPPPAGGYAPPAYGGPVPPGGWQQPVARPAFDPSLGELAGWGSRVGAHLLDSLFVILAVVVGVALIVGAAAINNVLGIVVGVIVGLALLAIYLLYWTLLTARKGERNGQTWGKQITGIRVVRDNGIPMDFGQSLLRELVVQGILFGAIGGSFFFPPILNYLWPLWDDSNRALHDMIVSTHVVKA